MVPVSRGRAVILDLEGTLLDSNDARTLAWLEAFRDAGHLGLRPQTIRRLIGLAPDQVVSMAAGVRTDSPEGEEILARHAVIFRRHYLPGLLPFLHARELCERLVADGILLAVMAPEPAEDLGALLARAGIGDLVGATVSLEDEVGFTPRPDALLVAMERAGATRESALCLGDTPYDVEAAWNAGLPVVAMRSGGWGELDLGGAAAIYGGPAHLLAEYEVSPLGRLAALGTVPVPAPALAVVRHGRLARRTSRADTPHPV